MHAPPPELFDPLCWQAPAAGFLAQMGFVLVRDEGLDAASESCLLVALRPAPTLRHFDPERIDYWTSEQGRGRHATIERAEPPRRDARFAWGSIEIADRAGVRNAFLAFGGELRAQSAPDGSLLVAFASPAPILRLAGHSQGVDPLSPEVGLFFGRIKVPIDFVADAETRIAATPPEALYAAFVADLAGRFGRSETLRAAHHSFAAWAPREARRIERDRPEAWSAAARLLADLELPD